MKIRTTGANARKAWVDPGRRWPHPGSFLALVATLGALAPGCASMNRTEQGATTGAAAGAVIGGIIGENSGSTAKGAILGAVIGGTAGAVIGRRMDNQAAELEEELEGAEVERVGEGIQVTFESGLLFDFDSDVLRMQARENLGSLAETMKSNPGTELVVVGHTDAVGSADYNAELSRRRAEAGRRFLLAQGIPSDAVRAEGRGELEPIASNDTDAGRQENRRVEVAIFASEELRAEMIRRHGGRTVEGIDPQKEN